MKILVTGGAGFIASNLVDAYIEAGHQVAVVDNLVSGKRANLNPKADFYYMEIGDPRVEEIFRHFKPDIVNHHAAQIDVRKSVEDPVFDAQTNILDAIFLLNYCHRYGIQKFIFSSTGGALYGEPEYLPCDENHPILPLAAYGLSKYCFENYILLFNRLYGLPYVILRYANVYGPRQDPHGEAGVVAIFTGKLLKGETPAIFGNGEQSRDFVFVEDICRANLMALEAKENLTVNLGTGQEVSVNTLLKKIQQALGTDLTPQYLPERPGEVSRIYLDAQKAKNLLGWEPKFTLEQGLEKTVNYFKHQPACAQ